MDSSLVPAASGEIALGVLTQWTRKCRLMGTISVHDRRRMWCVHEDVYSAHGETGLVIVVSVQRCYTQ